MQPWPGEVLEDRAGEIAVGFAALLTRQAAWRHRRVETITVLSHEQVRRHVSVDFTVPVEHREDVRLASGQYVVPLALLAKRHLVHFDLRGEDDSSLPLLRSDEAQQIARELLYLVLDLDEAELDASGLIERVLAAGPDDAALVDAELAAVADRAPGFAALAGQLTRGFLLCAVLTDVDRRRVIKFAYDEPLGRPDREVHFYDAPGCTEAASYHVEIAVPDEMRARTTQLVDDRTGEVLAVGLRDSDRPAVRYSAEPGVQMQPGLSVHYGLERGRFLVPAALVAWVIALELALPLLLADLGALATSGGPAIAVLLSSTAVFSALVLRSGEHPLVRL
ncbi:MAG TPA: hypothetical protein VFZ00_01795, partial [Solirubrobacter sp.]|nr:hypothetical protein [Solirubrobacter sp.]